MQTFIKKNINKLSVFILLSFISLSAQASSTGLPWESPLQKILDSLSGPVAKILGVIAIVITGLGIAFGEAGGGMRKLFQIVFGLSIAFTASSLLTSLFGFSGGSVI